MTNPQSDTELVEHRPLRHGLTALIVRRCPHHPVDYVTSTGQCLACADHREPYGEWI